MSSPPKTLLESISWLNAQPRSAVSSPVKLSFDSASPPPVSPIHDSSTVHISSPVADAPSTGSPVQSASSSSTLPSAMLATRLQRAADMKFDVGGGRLSVAQAVLGTAMHSAEFHADTPATEESNVGEDEQVQRGILTKADVALSQFAHAQPSNANAVPNQMSAVDADAAKALLDALRDPSQTRSSIPALLRVARRAVQQTAAPAALMSTATATSADEQFSATALAAIEKWLLVLATVAVDSDLLDCRPGRAGAYSNKTPMDLLGVSRSVLERRQGLTIPFIDRVFRGLFVFSVGIHSQISDALRHCPRGPQLMRRVWPVYLRALETADPATYELAVSCLLVENAIARSETDRIFRARLKQLDEQVQTWRTEVSSLSTRITTATDAGDTARDATHRLRRRIEEIRLASLLQTDEQNVLSADLEEWRQAVKDKERALAELEALQTQVDKDEVQTDRTVANLRAQLEGERNHAVSLQNSLVTTKETIIVDQKRCFDLLAELKVLQAQAREESATRRAYLDIMQRETELRMQLDSRILAELTVAERSENDRSAERDTHWAHVSKIDTLKQKHGIGLMMIEALLMRRRDTETRRTLFDLLAYQRVLAELQQLADTQDAKIRQLDFKIVEIASAHETELDLQQQLRATKMQAMALDRNMRFCRFHLTRARNVQSRLERMHAFVCRSVSVIQLQLAEERKTLSHIKEDLEKLETRRADQNTDNFRFDEESRKTKRFLVTAVQSVRRSIAEAHDKKAFAEQQLEIANNQFLEQRARLSQVTKEIEVIRNSLTSKQRTVLETKEALEATRQALIDYTQKKTADDLVCRQLDSKLADVERDRRARQATAQRKTLDLDQFQLGTRQQLEAAAVMLNNTIKAADQEAAVFAHQQAQLIAARSALQTAVDVRRKEVLTARQDHAANVARLKAECKQLEERGAKVSEALEASKAALANAASNSRAGRASAKQKFNRLVDVLRQCAEDREKLKSVGAECNVTLHAMINVKKKRNKAILERTDASDALSSARVQHRYVMYDAYRLEEDEFFRRTQMTSRTTQTKWVDNEAASQTDENDFNQEAMSIKEQQLAQKQAQVNKLAAADKAKKDVKPVVANKPATAKKDTATPRAIPGVSRKSTAASSPRTDADSKPIDSVAQAVADASKAADSAGLASADAAQTETTNDVPDIAAPAAALSAPRRTPRAAEPIASALGVSLSHLPPAEQQRRAKQHERLTARLARALQDSAAATAKPAAASSIVDVANQLQRQNQQQQQQQQQQHEQLQQQQLQQLLLQQHSAVVVPEAWSARLTPINPINTVAEQTSRRTEFDDVLALASSRLSMHTPTVLQSSHASSLVPSRAASSGAMFASPLAHSRPSVQVEPTRTAQSHVTVSVQSPIVHAHTPTAAASHVPAAGLVPAPHFLQTKPKTPRPIAVLSPTKPRPQSSRVTDATSSVQSPSKAARPSTAHSPISAVHPLGVGTKTAWADESLKQPIGAVKSTIRAVQPAQAVPDFVRRRIGSASK